MDTARRWADEFEDDGHPEQGWVVHQLLDLKRGYLDEDLRRWTTAELEEVLLELMPRKSSLEEADIPTVVPTVAAFLRWSGARGRLRQAEELAAHVEGLAGAFADAMRDPSRWGMAKTLFAGPDFDGLDLTDPAAVQRAVEAYNARPFDERHLLTGPAQALPPVRLMPEQDLDRAATGARLVHQVLRLRAWVGDRRVRLTDAGNLRLADARELVQLLGTGDVLDTEHRSVRSSTELRELDLVLQLALVAGVLQDGPRVLHGTGLDAAPRELASLLLEALLVARPHEFRDREIVEHLVWWAEAADDLLAALPLELYPDGEADEEDLRGALLEVLETTDLTLNAFQRQYSGDMMTDAHDRTLGWLQDSGCVELAGGRVRLTDLGRYAVQRLATRRGFDAPVVGSLLALDAAALLEAALDLPEGLAAAELDAWLAEHSPDELCGALGVASPAGRALAFRALLRLGSPADAAVLALAPDPLAELWRVDARLEPPTPATDPARLVAVLSVVIDVWGPGAAGRWALLLSDDVLPLIAQAWRVPHPAIRDVLAAVGDASAPGNDKALAKEARRALHKVR